MKRTFGCLFLIIGLVSYRVAAQEFILNSSLSGGRLIVTAKFDCDCSGTVLDHLEDGMEAEIIFQVRLYEERRRFSSLWGGRIVEEKTVSYTGRKDLFDRTYILTTRSGNISTYKVSEEFLSEFFMMEDSSFVLPSARKNYYLLARVHLDTVKLVPPLNLINLLGRTGMTTGWKKVSVGQKK